MTSSFSIQAEICVYFCIWFVFVTLAMIYALWPIKESPPSRPRHSSTQHETANASVGGQPTLARQFAADAERRHTGDDLGVGPPDRGEESALDPPVTTCHTSQDP
jgi:hypothetical protein